MVVVVRIEVTDEQRKALRARMGRVGKATRHEIRSLAETAFDLEVTDATEEYRASIPNVFDGAR